MPQNPHKRGLWIIDKTTMGNDVKLLKLHESARKKLERLAKEAAETELKYWLAILYSDAIVPSRGLRIAWLRICGLLESLGRNSDEHRHQYDRRKKTAPRTADLEEEERKRKYAEERDRRRTHAMMNMKNFLAETRDALTSHKKGYGVNWPTYGYVSWSDQKKTQALKSILNIKEDLGEYDVTLKEVGSTETEVAEMKAYIETIPLYQDNPS